MKRVAIAAIILLVAGTLVSAQDMNANNWDSYFKAGDSSVSLGVGVGLGSFFSVAAYPAFEQTVFDTKIADTLPMGIGVAVKGLAQIYLGGVSGIAVGAGAFVPFHFSLKGLDLEILNRLDFYVAPGIALTLDLGGLAGATPLRLGFGDYAGVNYFVSDTMAVFVEQVYWRSYTGATIGITLKL